MESGFLCAVTLWLVWAVEASEMEMREMENEDREKE